ncbi:MAG: response regulator [Myxococcota bacterium]|nr:response regulator [Myxococcota bacterium]
MILVVDDNQSAAQALARVLNRRGHAAQAVFDGPSAVEVLEAGGVDWVFTDLKMEPMDGLELLRVARALPQPPQVVLMTGFGSVDLAVQAMQEGARDFLTKPVSPTKVLEILTPAQDHAAPSLEPAVVGESPAAQNLRRQLTALRQVDSSVLFVGEPGSGRAELARSLHQQGRLLSVSHPDQIPASLEGIGTLLLPSVDLLSAAQHRRLLQILDCLPPQGGPRVLASAAADWQAKAALEPDSSALYYRLAVLVVPVPALRQRMADLPALIAGMLERRAQALGAQPPTLSAERLAALQDHDWPGNLRELAALVERALVFGSFETAQSPRAQSSGPSLGDGFSLALHLEQIERSLLLRAAEESGGDRTQMGELLGVERNTLRYKLKKYGLLDRVG